MDHEKLKKLLKKLSPGKIIVLILVGICLAILAMPLDSQTEEKAETKVSGISYRSDLEYSLITFLSKLEGVGDADVIIYTKENNSSYFGEGENTGEIIGVLVSCEGAGSYAVQSEIIESVSALFGISANKIKVLKSEFQKE